jgi:hypothetical protein
MNLTRIRTMVALAGASLAVTLLVLRLSRGGSLEFLNVPWSVAGLIAALACGILAAAWPVRQYVKGKRPSFDPLRAASILALAKSCTLAGAALSGPYIGMGLFAIGGLHSAAAWVQFSQEVAAALAAVFLAVAGRIAESFCRLPPNDEQIDLTGSQADAAS